MEAAGAQVTETPQVEEHSAEAEGTQEDRIDRLEGKVDSIIDRLASLLPGGGGEAPAKAEPEAAEPDISSQVKAELAKLKAAEDRKAKAEARDKEVDELKETVAKIKEKPPKEYRRVTNLVWGRDED